MRSFLALVFLLSVLGSSEGHAQLAGADVAIDPNGRLVLVYEGSHWTVDHRRPDSGDLFLRTGLAGVERRLWEGDGNINWVSISPAGDLAAFVHNRIMGPKEDPYAWASPGRNVLHVVDLEGRFKARVEEVFLYSWSPDGERLVVITGIPSEGGFGSFCGEIEIIDAETGSIFHTGLDGCDLHWAEHDAAIYTRTHIGSGGTVIRYFPETDRAEVTPFHGLRFSPTGEYYYEPSWEGIPFELYEASNNTEIHLDSKFLNRTDRIWSPRGWLDAVTLVLPPPNTMDENDYLFDVETGEVFVVPGPVLGMVGDSVVVAGPDRFELLPLRTLEPPASTD